MYDKEAYINVKEDEFVPMYASSGSAGMDLKAYVGEPLTIHPKTTAFIPTGFEATLPQGTFGMIASKSGLVKKKRVYVDNQPGIIDSDYPGEWMVLLRNGGDEPFVVNKGDSIAQVIVIPYVKIDHWLKKKKIKQTTERKGGFGSTKGNSFVYKDDPK